MKKWIGLMALVTAASSVNIALATSLYEPFNYPAAANGTSLGHGQTAADGSPFNLTDTSEVPNQPWGLFTSGTNDPQYTNATLPTGSNPIVYPGLAIDPTTGYGQLNNNASSGNDRIDLNASYGPGSTIYYSMVVEVPVGASYVNTLQLGQMIAGIQWESRTQTTETGYNSTAYGGALMIRHTSDDTNGDTIPNDANGNPQFELGVAYTNNTGAPHAFDESMFLQEGVPYLAVVKYITGTGNTDDSASLYINPLASTFGQADPGVPSVTSANNPFTNDNGYNIGGPTIGQYIGPHISLELQDNSGQPNHIDVKDIRVDSSWAGVTGVEWTGSGNWGTGSNWTSGVAPSATGADVTFGVNSTNYNVNLDAPETVGTVRFNGTNSYTIGGSTLTLQENVAPTVPADGTVYLANAPSYSPATIQVTAGSHSVTAPLQMASDTEIGVAPGASLSLTKVTAASGISLRMSGGGSATITPASATALQGLSGSDLNYGLTVSGASSLKISPAHAVITTDAISIDDNTTFTSTLDLTNNDLIVDYAPNTRSPGGTDTTTGPAVVAAVGAAYDNGLWDKAGITTSLAPAGAGRTLAVVDNGQLNTALTTVDGVTLDDSSVVVKYTWYGDLNLDGVVDATDVAMMSDLELGWAGGDLNYDGKPANPDDWSLLFLGSAESGGANISSVPEPGAIMLLASLGLLGLRRRRGI